ncbi:MAG: carboxypeptidase-like regulatory domain-containing protein [Pedobacter sp.]|nr:carboxypeptidase-like regulatory domain-containing protein [Pedobacter sp.]
MKLRGLLILIFVCSGLSLKAQHSSDIPKLYHRISINADKQPLADVLNEISRKGNFIFSYSGTVFNPDSLVTLNAKNETVRDVLDRIFLSMADYRESGNYVILRSTIRRFSIHPELIKTDHRHYLISGYVIDEKTGQKVPDASVYEKRLLESTLSDKDGYFRMRIRGSHQSVILTLSKESYRDTSMLFLSTVTIKPEGYTYEDEEYMSYASNIVEKLGIGRFLVSAKQQIQSLNISGFLTSSPYQASLLPGLSSHGMFSSQVVNKASLNLLGGYTAGVDGAEVAGLFNISKNNVQYVQLAGLANLVGGSVRGFQAGGLVNSVLDSLVGFQAAGIVNDVRSGAEGWQAAGIFNHVRRDLNGWQVAGIGNLASGNTRGVQTAGIGNVAAKQMKGIQIGGIFNYAKEMKGLQIGLVNVADTSSGFSIGLINWVNKGYHKLSLSSTDVFGTQLAVKTGTAKFYTMLIMSGSYGVNDRVYSAGYGIGHEFIFSKRLSASAELSSQGLYLGNWDYPNILNKGQLNMQFKLAKGLNLFAGPSYSLYYSDPASLSSEGYRERVAPKSAKVYSPKTKGWLGWSAGINLF